MPPSELRGLPMLEVLKRLNIKRRAVPRLVILGREEMAKEIASLDVFEGMPTQLRELYTHGIKVCILSTNSKESIHAFLKTKKLDSIVDKVVGDIRVMGKSKEVKRLVQSYDCGLGEFIYIGDEVRDIQAAQRAGVLSMAVTWGFNTKEILENSNPTYLARKPIEISEHILAKPKP